MPSCPKQLVQAKGGGQPTVRCDQAAAPGRPIGTATVPCTWTHKPRARHHSLRPPSGHFQLPRRGDRHIVKSTFPACSRGRRRTRKGLRRRNPRAGQRRSKKLQTITSHSTPGSDTASAHREGSSSFLDEAIAISSIPPSPHAAEAAGALGKASAGRIPRAGQLLSRPWHRPRPGSTARPACRAQCRA